MRKISDKAFRKNNDDFPVEVKLEQNNYICSYEDCVREFEKLILITNKSANPPQTYLGCPYCLSRIDVEALEAKKIKGKTSKHQNLLELRR